MGVLKYEDWQNHWQKLFEKLDEEGYESFTYNERIWYNVRGVINSIDNGGIISFYYNYGADTLEDTMEDLQKLNATDVVNLLKQVNALFPDGKPSNEINKRNDVINSWDEQYDDLLESLDEQFYKLESDLELKLETIVQRIVEE